MTRLLWSIEQGRLDSTAFFKALPEHFAEATTFYAEGTSVRSDVVACYKRHLEPGKFLPGANTLFPISKKFRCVFSNQLLAELAALSERHAEPEMLDHLFAYAGSEPILQWHDAFANSMLLSDVLSEERVSAFAQVLGLPYGRAKFG